mmetsp:Transcript_28069/g.67067  ORF Transcript_28069/g.67067 Transcript_28069/m.67067 type:complete len:232 (-) Transcript_28069:3676-4371(-)
MMVVLVVEHANGPRLVLRVRLVRGVECQEPRRMLSFVAVAAITERVLEERAPVCRPAGPPVGVAEVEGAAPLRPAVRGRVRPVTVLPDPILVVVLAAFVVRLILEPLPDVRVVVAVLASLLVSRLLLRRDARQPELIATNLDGRHFEHRKRAGVGAIVVERGVPPHGAGVLCPKGHHVERVRLLEGHHLSIHADADGRTPVELLFHGGAADGRDHRNLDPTRGRHRDPLRC